MRIEGTLTVQHQRRVDLLAVFTSIHRSSQKERSRKLARTLALLISGMEGH
jgi:hypothetical protein